MLVSEDISSFQKCDRYFQPREALDRKNIEMSYVESMFPPCIGLLFYFPVPETLRASMNKYSKL